MEICLGIDASAQEISAAVVVDGILAAEEIAAARPSGEVLLSLIDRALAAAGKRLDEVSSIAVGIGPGSFTGIRNGIATAQGLATPLGGGEEAKAVFGVSALLAAAHSP